VVFTLPGGDLRIERTDPRVDADNSKSSLKLEVFLPASDQILNFKGVRHRWTHRELMQAWHIAPKERSRYLAVLVNGELAGLYNGEKMLRPDVRGAQRECRDLPVKLCYC